jgi:hypothetical protein
MIPCQQKKISKNPFNNLATSSRLQAGHDPDLAVMTQACVCGAGCATGRTAGVGRGDSPNATAVLTRRNIVFNDRRAKHRLTDESLEIYRS